MKKIIACLPGLFFASTVFSQTNLKALSFNWTEPVMTEWNGDEEKKKLEDGKMTSVIFFGSYKNINICDFTYSWKCGVTSQTYVMVNGVYQPIHDTDIFNEKAIELLDPLNKAAKAQYDELLAMDPDVKDMLGEFQLCTNINQINVAFGNEYLTLGYIFDLPPAYDCCSGTSISYSWNEILPYLKRQETKTPAYCTPSGPKVNVRSDQSVAASVNFQLDRGQFFEILETGKKDKVNGKDGYWYKIIYEGKSGFIFSFYTLCPVKE